MNTQKICNTIKTMLTSTLVIVNGFSYEYVVQQNIRKFWYTILGRISGNAPYISTSELAEGTGFLHLLIESCLESQYGLVKVIINFTKNGNETSSYHWQHKMFLGNAIYKN